MSVVLISFLILISIYDLMLIPILIFLYLVNYSIVFLCFLSWMLLILMVVLSPFTYVAAHPVAVAVAVADAVGAVWTDADAAIHTVITSITGSSISVAVGSCIIAVCLLWSSSIH